MRELSVLALLFAVACSGKSAGDISSSTGGSDNAGESGSNTGGSAGTSGGSDGGASPTSGGNGAAPSGGSSGSAGNGASGGNAGTSGGSAGDSGNGGNAGEGATAGDGGSGGIGRCEDVTTLEECDARSDCHSVFFDPNDCACAALGCCARFSSCAGGDLAECDGMVTCRRAAPYCAGQYVISYEGTCYEGCVRSSECLP